MSEYRGIDNLVETVREYGQIDRSCFLLSKDGEVKSSISIIGNEDKGFHLQIVPFEHTDLSLDWIREHLPIMIDSLKQIDTDAVLDNSFDLSLILDSKKINPEEFLRKLYPRGFSFDEYPEKDNQSTADIENQFQEFNGRITVTKLEAFQKS